MRCVGRDCARTFLCRLHKERAAPYRRDCSAYPLLTTSLPWQYGQAPGIAFEAEGDLFAVMPPRLARAVFRALRRCSAVCVFFVFLGLKCGYGITLASPRKFDKSSCGYLPECLTGCGTGISRIFDGSTARILDLGREMVTTRRLWRAVLVVRRVLGSGGCRRCGALRIVEAPETVREEGGCVPRGMPKRSGIWGLVCVPSPCRPALLCRHGLRVAVDAGRLFLWASGRAAVQRGL